MTFRVYQDPAAAYADAVAGSLDYIDDSNIPGDQFVGDAYMSDFPDRTSQRESLIMGWIDLLARTTRSSRTTCLCARPSPGPSTGI